MGNNYKLEVLKRKHQGRQIKYKDVFLAVGFREFELSHIDIEATDKVMSNVKLLYKDSMKQVEVLKNDEHFIESNLIRNAYLKLNENAECYIYTDDFRYCGMYLINAKRGLELALEVSKNDINNTCFILDKDLKYIFSITFNDADHNDDPNTFDIQLSELSR